MSEASATSELTHLIEELGEVAPGLLFQGALEVDRFHDLLVEVPAVGNWGITRSGHVQRGGGGQRVIRVPDVGLDGRPKGRVADEAAEHVDTPRAT